MKTVGIVAEFNPFHNGHKYLIDEAMRIYGADACVVAMSGNFTQRGMPAVADKWDRTYVALNEGADLVVEIPVVCAVADAGRYAKASVGILKALGCDAIAFGSESGDYESLFRVAERLKTHADEINQHISILRKQGISYPAAREQAYIALFNPDDSSPDLDILSSPNDILGIEYIKYADGMDVIPVKRQGAGYYDDRDETKDFQSASGIRKAVLKGESVISYVPNSSFENLFFYMNNYSTVENIYFNLARNTILTTSSEKLSDTPSGEEGLSCRLKESASKCNNLEELIEGSKTKAYTYTRINRIITQAILHIDREEANQGALYVRVLGFSKKGREIIKEIKKSDNETLPVLTNINKEAGTLDELTYKQLEKDILAGDMYSVLVNRPLYEHSDKVRMPILLEK